MQQPEARILSPGLSDFVRSAVRLPDCWVEKGPISSIRAASCHSLARRTDRVYKAFFSYCSSCSPIITSPARPPPPFPSSNLSLSLHSRSLPPRSEL